MNRRGYSLIEFMLIFVALAILLNVLAAIMISSNRLSTVGISRIDRLEAREMLGHTFTYAVHSASQFTVEGYGASSPEKLVVQTATNEAIIILRAGDALAQRRIALTESGIEERGFRRIPRAIASHQFIYANQDPTTSPWVELRVVFADDPNATEHSYFATQRLAKVDTP